MSLLDATWPLVRPALFSLDAERAHDATMAFVSAWPGLARLGPGLPDASLRTTVAGVPWAGPVGLAAGLDKNGRAIPFFGALGFGSLEVGTVTMHAQPGNPKPRMFRYPQEGAVLNRLGFNNLGSAALRERLEGLRSSGRWPRVPVGANVGKSKVTSNEDAPTDYATSIGRLRGLVDWFTVNVSSPNTPGLRALQDEDSLRRLLPAALEAAAGTPVFLKLAPDLEDEALVRAVTLAREAGIAAIVATNTTLRREGAFAGNPEAGGLSGRPLWPLAREKIRVAKEAAGSLPVVGVGGVETADQVRELLALGCAAVQVYTGFVFHGPGLPGRLHAELARRG